MRYPLAPLLRVTRCPDLHELANRLGRTHGHLRNVAKRGLSDRQADHWAVALGLHPSWVWGKGWWENAPSNDELKAA